MNDMLPQKIYFDESGFTGNHLLNPHQPLFSYGSVATTDEEAKEFVQDIIRIYKIQNGELKGSKLLKYNQGRNAIIEVLSVFKGRMKCTLANKKYALAGKMFEYLFEPCIAENNMLFYQINFHRFIANYLYVEFEAKRVGAEELFTEFEKMMRENNVDGINCLFQSNALPRTSDTLIQIREFLLSQMEHVAQEIAGLPGEGVGKWTLDLTDTMLLGLLAQWGNEYDQITAICDQSKPLNDNRKFFDIMINAKEKIYSPLPNTNTPLTCNLSGPIELVNSKEVHGVQIADTIAAAFVYACGDANDKLTQKCRDLIPEVVADGNLIPESRYIDWKRIDVKRNALLLYEIHARATSGLSLLDNLPEYLESVTKKLVMQENDQKFPIFMNKRVPSESPPF